MKKILHTIPKESREDLGIVGGLFIVASIILIMSLYVIPSFAKTLDAAGIIHKHNPSR